MSMRIPSLITATEFARRLAEINLDQSKFARRSGLSWDAVHEYRDAKARLPACVVRCLQFEEALYALGKLAQTDAERVGKRRMVEILRRAAEPITSTQKPPKKRVRAGRRRNYLAPRYLKLPPAQPSDPLEQPATWQQLAARIGEDEAKRLHDRLAQRRPPQPRRHRDEAPIPRNSDPI
jgi:hypothetical protein